MLGTARYHVRACLGARWRSYIGGIVVFALLGGVSLAAVAGARRTASAYGRFLGVSNAPTMVFNAGGYDPAQDEAVRRLPQVAATATYVGMNVAPLDARGRPMESAQDVEVLGSVDGRFFRLDRPAVVRGRLPDPDRPDEAAVNEQLFEDTGAHLGQRVPLGVYTDEQVSAPDFFDAPPEPVGKGTVTIVGVVVFGDEVVQGDAERYSRLLLTPAFTRPHLAGASYAWQAIVLRRGGDDVVAVQARIRAAVPPERSALFRVTGNDVSRVQNASRPLALALGVFGLLAGLATMVLVGQAVLRAIRVDAVDAAILRSLGAGPRAITATVAAGPVAMVVLGALCAAVVAVALSPLAPMGAARRVEARPGLDVDWSVVGAGLAAVAGVLVVFAILVAARQGGRGSPRDRRWSGRPSRVATLATGAGLPVPLVTGARMALEGPGGGGRAPAATRSAMTGAVIAVVAVAASLCFSASLRGLVDKPRLYGWDWDIALDDNVGYGGIDRAQAHAVLDADRDVAAWAPVSFGASPLDGQDTPLLGVDPSNALTPPLLSGRRLTAIDEVVLGPTTLARLHKTVGDQVRLGPAGSGTRLRIVGTATFPAIGPLRGSLTSLGTGAMVAGRVVPGSSDADPSAGLRDTTIFVRLRRGTVASVAGARLERAMHDAGEYPGSITVEEVRRPAEIVNSQSMGLAPAVLAAAVAAAVLVSLALALTASVRRRRRELALLKVLGFTRSQLGWAVVTHATLIAVVGVAVGLPAGVALGRWLWVLFARELAVVPSPVVPLGLLAAVAAAVVVLSNVAAAVPVALARRTPAAETLRSD